MARPCAGGEGVTPVGSGYGALTSDEACHDSNTAADDGCAANCLSTRAGFQLRLGGAGIARLR